MSIRNASRAGAASSAVPLALSPVTINNYGGRCNYRPPSWVKSIIDPAHPDAAEREFLNDLPT